VLATSQLVNHLSIAPTFSLSTDLVHSLRVAQSRRSDAPSGGGEELDCRRRTPGRIGLEPAPGRAPRGRCERMRLRKTGSREVTGRRRRLAGPRVASKMAKWLPADQLAVE
jgi:hypothetical protein